MTTLTDPTFPLGVSQWESHGRAFGYWDYFAKEAGRAYLLSVLPEMRTSNAADRGNDIVGGEDNKPKACKHEWREMKIGNDVFCIFCLARSQITTNEPEKKFLVWRTVDREDKAIAAIVNAVNLHATQTLEMHTLMQTTLIAFIETQREIENQRNALLFEMCLEIENDGPGRARCRQAIGR